MTEAVGNEIYSFPFSFRGGHTLDDGFLLTSENSCFLFSGEKVEFPYLNAPDMGELDDNAENDDDELLEFDMM